MRTKGPVEATKHVAFLHCWLTFHVFCSRTMQVPQYLLPIAQLLHEGMDICLSKLLLATLYDSLSDVVTILWSPFPITLTSGPFWLLQLWLNSIFGDDTNVTNPIRTYFGPIGIYLTFLTPVLEKTQYFEAFQKFFDLFYHLDSGNKFIAPFALRMYGPSWLTLPLSLPKEIISLWREFITPSLLQASFLMKRSSTCFIILTLLLVNSSWVNFFPRPGPLFLWYTSGLYQGHSTNAPIERMCLILFEAYSQLLPPQFWGFFRLFLQLLRMVVYLLRFDGQVIRRLP